MNEQNHAGATKAPGIRETFGLDHYEFTRGKVMLVVAAVGMMLVGLGLGMVAPDSTETSVASTSTHPEPKTAAKGSGQNEDLMRTTFGQGGGIDLPIPGFTNAPSNGTGSSSTGPAPTSSEIGSADFSKMFVKGGFGLFVGFAIGFAIRAFIKLATVIIGFYLLTLTMLAYAGWVEIHWDIMEGQFNGLISNLGAQFESFKAFLTGSIPSSGLTAAGLAGGLRQK
ncbi:MAG: putative membrane protein (Fun14 family) [Limisphaerales bacterium]|jgi:uncharacterized membrane protein (Fun14 family)